MSFVQYDYSYQQWTVLGATMKITIEIDNMAEIPALQSFILKLSAGEERSVTELNLPERILRALMANEIYFVSQLEGMKYTDIYKIPNIGSNSAYLIEEAVRQFKK